MATPGWITRFAPSPTGALHLGHAYAARFAWRAAQRSGGRFLLRLEDLDAARCRPEHAAAALAELAWIGFEPEGEVLRQSARLPLYAASLAALRERGLLYPCFCSRAAIAREVAAAASAPQGPDGGPLYPRTCRRLSRAEAEARIAAGAPHAWRLDIEAARLQAGRLEFRENGKNHPCRPEAFGDVVLGRRDLPGSYHLCATQDDAAQGVTLVTRGEDLRPATHLHRLLQALMGWPAPHYAHHRLIAAADGTRLAKRDGAPSLAAMRAAGMRPEAVLAMLPDD